MTKISDPSSSIPGSSPFATALTPIGGTEGIRESLTGKHVCPFCGSVNDSEQGMCPRCTMENSAATRKATKTRIGPWYVLQTRNPAAPGMTWETLVGFVRKGRVKPRSIVRGPTTHQLWRFAAHVKGLSREFGICYSCGSTVEAAASLCPTCNRLQDPPPNPDALLEASREGQQTYATPPATIDGTVLLNATGPATVVGQVPAELGAASIEATPPTPPPPDEAEFVIPALGGGGGADGGAEGQGAGDDLRIPPLGGAADPLAPATPGGPAGTKSFHGISGDTTWTRIGSTRDMLRDPTDALAAGAPAGGVPAGGAQGREPTRDRPAPRPPGGNRPPNRPGANTNAPRFNPYADEDVAPVAPNGGRRNDGDGFLSAKDLAAAFNLSFVGEDDEAPVQQTVRPGAAAAAAAPQPTRPQPAAPAAGAAAPVAPARNPVGNRHAPAGPINPRVMPGNRASAAAAAAAHAALNGMPGLGVPNYPPRGRPPKRKLKVVLALLFIGAAAFGMAMAASDSLRTATFNWFRKATASLNKSADDDQAGPPARRPRPASAPAGEGARPATGPTGRAPAAGGTAAGNTGSSMADGGGGGAAAPPVPAPTGGTPAVPPAVSRPAPVGGTGSPPSPAPGTPTGAPARPGGTASWRETEAYKLYNQAIDLEVNDPALAIAKYKQIKRLPADTWPTDLDVRIKRMEEKLKQLYGQPG